MDLETYIRNFAETTGAQQSALLRIFYRHVKHTDHPDFAGISFEHWVQSDVVLSLDDCLLAAVPHEVIGIEPDGHVRT
tara:strand:- start:220 stop:453 length:234 start_codon:yes stop_codon:yes gene_type:complete